MRDELHLMELVDRYLDEGMGTEERAAFEERMKDSHELRSLVDDQRALREGFRRLHLRRSVVSAHRAWSLRRWLPWAVASVLAIGAAVLLAGLPVSEHAHERSEITEATNVTSDTNTVRSGTEEGASTDAQAHVGPVYAQTRPPALADTGRGEGLVITHLLTEQENGSIIDSVIPSQPALDIEGAADGDQPTTAVNTWGTMSDSLVRTTTPTPRALMYTVEDVPEGGTAPSFPEGITAMQSFIDGNLRYPRGKKDAGVVVVRFQVSRKGEVLEPEIKEGMGRAFDAEALRVVRKMPHWLPARSGDRPIRSRVNLLIRFEPKAKASSREQRPAPVLDRR